jgi:hypothetical protein
MFRPKAALIPLALLAACAQPAAQPSQSATQGAGIPLDAQIPPFASKPYEPLSRAAVVAIAMREWRVFGQPVDDDPPDTRPPPPPDQKPERIEGLWQRVGEYWWLGLDSNDPDAGYTGKHNAAGNVFPAAQDGYFAWSAAFISYVFRIAGATTSFPYAASHATYINAAKNMTDGQGRGYVVFAERPEAYAPREGDLICEGRGGAGRLKYDDLPTPRSFPGHCDIVVQLAPGQISVLGGNVDDAVTMKHIPVTPDGKLATPDGTVLDTRYPWMVVIRVAYDATPVS